MQRRCSETQSSGRDAGRQRRSTDRQKVCHKIWIFKRRSEGSGRFSHGLPTILRVYWRLARPKLWLLPGRGGDKLTGVQVPHAACRFATEVDIRIIQVLLGHNNLSTTAGAARASLWVTLLFTRFSLRINLFDN